ncbi:MAG: ADP-heptose--LPS heptosyltransferase 2 [Bacteroidetes bacterium ADurb.Bin408]|nr:MAG: ADP-heptose--LPS heptosyltransferase 2 [Bacteroidetes bacterium ADurb.Bin408]
MKKILIIRFSSIGDIVLTTPVVRCIKKQHPDIAVHFATKSAYKGLLEHNPYIDKLHLLDRSLHKLIQELRDEDFDYVVDLHNNIRSQRVCLALLKRVGRVYKLNFAKWLLVNTKTNLLPPVHIVDRYMAAAEALEITNDKQGLDYFLPQGTSIGRFSFSGMLNSTPYIAWAIGGKHTTKILPEDKVRNVCALLKCPVVLLGDNNDKERGEAIASGLPHVINATGQLNLHESALVLRDAAVVVTNDTGLMHIAAALGKKIVSVWGSTVKEFGMYPYMPQAKFNYRTIEVNDLDCRPCSKIGFKACPRKHFRCMREQDEQTILNAINSFLG